MIIFIADTFRIILPPTNLDIPLYRIFSFDHYPVTQ